MEHRAIGPLSASVVGLGCNNFGMRMDSQADVDAVVGAALDAGINYFDTAEMYGGGGTSEKMLGKALEGRRDEALVATKWGHARGRDEGTPGADRATIRACCEASLERLGVDVIDHYQLHTPDPMTPIAETLGALQELIDEGKIKAIGCSNFSADQLDEMAAAAKADGVTPFQTVQNRYSVLTRSPETDGVLEACTRNNVGFVPYFPLESGLLTGKVRKGQDAPEGTRLASDMGRMFLAGDMLDRAESLISYAEGHNQTILELAFSWLLAQANVVSVIAGATKPEQIAGNAGAAGWAMTSADLAAIDELVPAG
jgi:aryl-alcohol dehydrogenase-like predicted oxidoreductase